MKKITIMMLAAVCFAACRNDDPVSIPGYVTLDPIITGDADVNFGTNDRIGLTITRNDGTVYADNNLMTFANGLFSSTLKWYGTPGEAARLVAYYPYSTGGAPSSFTVATDQTSAGYAASDLMAATKSNVTPTDNAVSMSFRRLFAKVTVSATNASGADISAVVLSGSVPEATVDLASLSVAVSGTAAAADITTNASVIRSGQTDYQAILIPQKAALTLEVKLSNGTVLRQLLNSLTIEQGVEYSMDVRVSDNDLEVGSTGNLTPDNNIPFTEYAGYFVYDGVTYQTVTLSNGTTWMAEPLCFLPKGCTPSTDPAADSHIWYPYELEDDNNHTTINASRAVALTDDVSVRKNGYLYDVYAALGGVEITKDNCYDLEGAQGICPPGWHIPTRMDYVGLCGLSNKNAFGETGNYVDNTAIFYDAGYGGGKRTLYEDGGWNYVLSGVRMQSNFASTPAYQLTQLYPANTSLVEMYGSPALTYIMASTCYQPVYSSTADIDGNYPLTNIQFFTQMTTFSNSYKEGKINVAYISIKSGQQVRCMKNL